MRERWKAKSEKFLGLDGNGNPANAPAPGM
jgi:hypothetical protein